MNQLPLRRFARGTLLGMGLLAFCGCAELKQQLEQMTAFSRCQFRLASVDEVNLAGISLQGVTQLSDIDPLELLKLRTVFSTGSLPLQFTLNLEVKNPNSSTAAMDRFEWILFVDGNQLTSGLMERRVEIGPNGGVGALPMAIALDLQKTLSGKTLNSMVNLALNLAGEGSQPTHVTLQVKPTILVGGQALDYPGYITVSHDFTSGKND